MTTPTNKPDVAIFVALPEERDAVAQKFPLSRRLDPGVTDEYWDFAFSDVNGRRRTGVLIVANAMGPTSAARATERLFSSFSPALLVVIGIAGMLQDDAPIGTVIIGTSADEYLHDAKFQTSGGVETIDFESIKWSGEVTPTTYRLQQLLQSLPHRLLPSFSAWTNRCQTDLSRFVPAAVAADLRSKSLVVTSSGGLIRSGPIATGPFVVASEALKTILVARNRKFIAVEMETAAVLRSATQAALPPEVLVIRAISDPASNSKDSIEEVTKGALHTWCLSNAVALLKCALEELPVLRDSLGGGGEVAANTGPSLTDSRNEIHSHVTNVLLPDHCRPPTADSSSWISAAQELLSIITTSSHLPCDPVSMFSVIFDAMLQSRDSLPLRIEGPAGAGKSTLLSALYWYCYQSSLRDPSLPLPFFLNLHRYDSLIYDDNPSRTYESQARDSLERDLELLRNYLKRAPDTEVLIFVDGIDEDLRFRGALEQYILGPDFLPGFHRRTIAVTSSLGSRPDISYLFGAENVLSIRPVLVSSSAAGRAISAFVRLLGSVDVPGTALFLSSTVQRLGFRSIDLMTLALLHETRSTPALRDVRNLTELYVHWCNVWLNREGATDEMAAARQLAFSYEIERRKFSAEELRRLRSWKLIHTHETVRWFLIASHVIDHLMTGTLPIQNRITVLGFAYPHSINEFCKEMLNRDVESQRGALTQAVSLFSSGNAGVQATLVYLLGRLDDAELMQQAAQQLKMWTENSFSRPIDKLPRQQQMFLRTLLISRIRLGDDEARRQYVLLLIGSREVADVNRAFHLEYYGDANYDPAFGRNDHRDAGGSWDITRRRLCERIKNAGKDTDSLDVELLTLGSLAQHRDILGKLDSASRTEVRNALATALENDLLAEPETRNFAEMIHSHLGRTKFTTMSAFVDIYGVKRLPRAGWMSRNLGDIESVASHSFGAYLIGLFFLPEEVPWAPVFSKRRVLEMTLTHDLAEAFVGDLLPQEKTAVARTKESNTWSYIGLLQSYEGVGRLQEVAALYAEFDAGITVEARVARDLDKLDNLIQLLIVNTEKNVPDFSAWKTDLCRKILTPEGRRIMSLALRHFGIVRQANG